MKLSKRQFRPNTFLSLILSVIKCLNLVRKCHKNINLLNIKYRFKKDPDPVGSGLFWVTRIRIRIHIFKTGSADPGPEKMDRIRNTGFTCTAQHFLYIRPGFLLGKGIKLRVNILTDRS